MSNESFRKWFIVWLAMIFLLGFLDPRPKDLFTWIMLLGGPIFVAIYLLVKLLKGRR